MSGFRMTISMEDKMNILNQIIKRNFFFLSFLVLALLIIYVGEVGAEYQPGSQISQDAQKGSVESTISSSGETVEKEKAPEEKILHDQEASSPKTVESTKSYQTIGEASKYQKPKENIATLEIKSSVASGNYEIEIINGQTTAFQILEKASQIYNFDIEYIDYGGDLGKFITKIADISTPPDYSYFWCLYYNGEVSMLGASNLIMHIGDTVSWKFIKSNW